jgi:ADP-ribosyltransferase exoenzyme
LQSQSKPSPFLIMTPPDSVTSRVPAMQASPHFSKVFIYLTDEEKAVINAYTDRQYLNLNGYLRGKRYEAGHEDALKQISILLSNALLKITPPFNTGMAYRGCFISGEEIDDLKKAMAENTIVQHVYFSSSSKNAGMAFNGGGKNGMKIIKSKEGKLIMDLSRYPLEEEVLFNKDSSFRVTSINETATKIFVHLEEI